MSDTGEPCTFCEILAGRLPATIVAADALVIAAVDLRQFHPGHILIIPRRHVGDIRNADDQIAAAVMQMVARVARAVGKIFPNEGLSVWHSAGPAANQEVPHLHVHVHPRRFGDELLRIYPYSPNTPDRATLATLGAQVSEALADDQPPTYF